MSKLYPRFIAALFAICCCAPGWAQLTISPECSDQTVECIAALDDVMCPQNPVAYQAGEELPEPCGTAACILASEKQSNRIANVATEAVPINGAEAGALVLYNIQAFGVNSQFYVPKPGVGLSLEQFEPEFPGEQGIAILSGVVQGVEDPSEEWKVFAVYGGETSGADWVANGGGLKYEHDCLSTVQANGDDWQIYTMNGGMSFLEGQGSLTGSLLSLSHAPANEYFGFQVGEGANDRNCNYGAGGWFGWEGTIKGAPAAGAMGDFLVDLDPSQECYEACDARVTCFCIATDEDDNIFEVFECVTQRDDTTPPTMTNAPANVTIACTDNLPTPPTPQFSDNCTDVCAPTWALTPYLENDPHVCGWDDCDIELPFLVSYTQSAFTCTGDASDEHPFEECQGCGYYTRTWVFQDDCGNQDSYTQTITIVDEVAPTWNNPALVEYRFESCLTILTQEEAENPLLVPVYASDNCDDSLTYMISATELSGGCPLTWHRTWTAKDDCGNISEEFHQYVQLKDEVDPIVTAPADITIYLDDNCTSNRHPSVTGEATATDHCSTQERLDTMMTYTDSPNVYICQGDDNNLQGSYQFTRTWTTTDYCLNDGSDTQIITVLDTIAPEGEVHDVVLDCASFDCEIEYTQNGAPSATDNCDSDVANSWVNLHCVTFTVILDYWVPFEGMLILSESGEPIAEAAFSELAGLVDWNDGIELSETLMLEPGSYSIELLDSEGDGWVWNNVDGTDALVITYETLEMESAIAIDFTDGFSVSEDFDLDECGSRCGPEHPDYENSPEGEEYCYFRERLYTFVDDCGNESYEIQRIYLDDNEAPTFDGDNNVQLACDLYNEDDNFGGVLGLTNVHDNCAHDDDITITFTDMEMSAGCAGMFERTYVISDECGNSVTFVQYVTLIDNEAPTLSIVCPPTATIESDAYCTHDRSQSNTGVPSHVVGDNCDGSVNVQKTYVDGPDQVTCQGEFYFDRTWTVMAIDHCFNFTTRTCTQRINVIDDTAPAMPAITCPADITLELDAMCYADTDASITGMATATTLDNCDTNPDMDIWYMDGAPVYTCEADAGITANVTANLGALQSASASFNDDLVAVGLHIELDWASQGCTEWPSDLTLELTSPSGDCVTVYGYTSQDPNAACEAHSWPISWNTTTPGLFIMDFEFDEHIAGNGQWDLTVLENYDGACGVSVDMDVTVLRRAEGDRHFVRTWYAQATDCAGNESQVASCNQIISLEDNIAPEFGEFEMSIDIACDLYEEDALYGGINAMDNCDSNVKIEVLYNEDCDGDLVHGYENLEVSGGCAGSYLRTYLATDDCGNTTTTVQAINLIDEVAPEVTLTCPADITISKDEECFANDTRSGAGEADYEVTDNCSVDSVCVFVNDGPKEFTCENSYFFTREWIVLAYDACDNEGADTCYQVVTVVDDSAPAKPIINCPADQIRYRNANCFTDVSPCIPAGCNGPGATGTGNLTIDYITGPESTVAVGGCCDSNVEHVTSATNYDNCTSDDDLITVINYTDTPVGDVNCTHYIERHWTAYFIDECGNESEVAECTQIINIIDNTSPTITLDPRVYVDCAVFHANPDSIFATASDNCDPNVTLDLIDQDMIMPGTCAGLFENTYRATDCSGNQYTVSHLVELVDNVAPHFIHFPADAVLECGAGTTPDDIGTPTYADNCDSDGVSIDYQDIVATFKDDDCQTIERHWTITDPCGNATTQVQEYRIEDTGYPVIVTPACDHTFQCDGEGNLAEFQHWLDTHAGAEATDECSDINWDYEVPVVSAGPNPALSDGCGKTGEVTVTFYATDACGNSTATTATFTVVDTIAPSLENVNLPDDVVLAQTLNCDRSTGVNITGIPTAGASTDICCYNFVSISHEDGPIMCLCEPDDSFPFLPTFTDEELVTFAQIEAEIDGTVSFDWNYSTEDIEGPEFDLAVYVDSILVDILGANEQSGSLEVEVLAGETLGFGIMSVDNILGEASIEISNFSGPSGMDFIGVYDDAQWEQHEGYNGSLDWSHDGETLLITGSNVDLECEGSYEFIRTWTLYAFDECDNQSEYLVHEQLITVIDTIAPQFTETCGNDNGEMVAIDYDDAFGNCTIPAPCPVEAEDNCDADVVIECTVDTLGQYAPRGNVKNYSLATTPEAYQYGETCNGMTPHALRLMNLPNGDIYYDIIGEALMTELETGEVMLTCSLESHVLAGTGFNMTLKLLPEAMAYDLLYVGGADGNPATNDLLDPADLSLTVNNFLPNIEDLVSCGNLGLPSNPDFPKYIVDPRDGDNNLPVSRLTGYGSYAGSDLSLSNQPSNAYYGFQIGEGANQQNANFGMSGWFFYEGHFLGQPVMSSGDLFCDLDCTLPWGIQYCCTATDDCENSREFCYTYSITGDIDAGDDVTVSGQSGAGDHSPVVIGGAGDLTTGKTPIRVTNLQPNPTNDLSQLGFMVSENMRIRVDLVGMDGVLVAELYDGVAQSGVNHTLDIEAEGLSNGMYQVRLTSNDYLVVKKLLVND